MRLRLRDESSAERAIPRIFGLLLVIHQIVDEGLVLHHGVVDLALEKVGAAVHVASCESFASGARCGCTRRATDARVRHASRRARLHAATRALLRGS
jgi:hypothetical protein